MKIGKFPIARFVRVWGSIRCFAGFAVLLFPTAMCLPSLYLRYLCAFVGGWADILLGICTWMGWLKVRFLQAIAGRMAAEGASPGFDGGADDGFGGPMAVRGAGLADETSSRG